MLTFVEQDIIQVAQRGTNINLFTVELRCYRLGFSSQVFRVSLVLQRRGSLRLARSNKQRISVYL